MGPARGIRDPPGWFSSACLRKKNNSNNTKTPGKVSSTHQLWHSWFPATLSLQHAACIMSPRTWKDHQRSLVTRKFEASSILAVDPSVSIISAVVISWNTALFKSGRISWLPVSQGMSIGTMWMLGYAVRGKSRRNGVETSGFRSPLLGIKAFRTAQSSHFHSSKHQAKKKVKTQIAQVLMRFFLDTKRCFPMRKFSKSISDCSSILLTPARTSLRLDSAIARLQQL